MLSDVLRRQDAANNRRIIQGICQLVIGIGCVKHGIERRGFPKLGCGKLIYWRGLCKCAHGMLNGEHKGNGDLPGGDS